MISLAEISEGRIWSRSFKFLVLTISVFGCSGSEELGEDPSEPPEEPLIGEVEKVFSFQENGHYSYAPSIVEETDGTVHMFFCGNPEGYNFTDNIFRVTIDPKGMASAPTSILQPGPEGSWDDQHVCDPSVVEGVFNYQDEQYKYALFFLGSKKSTFYNEIGVAFSNDLRADNWVRYPNQLVKKTWIGNEDQSLGSGKSWGVGQPSVISIDKKGQLLLTFTVGDKNGTRVEWTLLDLSEVEDFEMTESSKVPSEGLFSLNYSKEDLTKNMDFGFDPRTGEIVAIRPVQPNPSSYPSFLSEASEIAVMEFAQFYEGVGKWTQLARISPAVTGFPRNHNPGLQRNSFGELDQEKGIEFYYTVSQSSPEVEPTGINHAEWTYTIWRGNISRK